MRTYQSGTKDKKSKENKRKIALTLLLTLSIIAVATIITLSFVLGNPPVDNTPDPEIPIVVPPIDEKPEFEVPVGEYVLGREASLTRVVFFSSMGYWRTHNGVDFLADAGTSVNSIAAGTVTAIQHTVLEATVITVAHANGLVSYYKGLGTNVAVDIGDVVEAGTKIGEIAEVMPYERDTGAHLHLETRLNGKLVNPANYLPDLGDK